MVAPSITKPIVAEPGSGIQPDGSCMHRWVIDGGTGRTKWGVCKHCDEGRWFKNMNLITVKYPKEGNASGETVKRQPVEVEREYWDGAGRRPAGAMKVIELGVL